MPEMDGYYATRKILEIRPDLPIIAVTAVTEQADPDIIEHCREAGIKDYLSKPIDVDKFLEYIREHLQA